MNFEFLLCLGTWWRIPTDYMISTRSLNEFEIGRRYARATVDDE